MPPKLHDVPSKFALSLSQRDALEEILPSVRALHEEWATPIAQLLPVLKKAPNLVKLVDKMCVQFGIPVRRTMLSRMEHLMAAVIQSKHNPDDFLQPLETEIELVSVDNLTPFKALLATIIQLRDAWQGEDEDSSDDDNDEDSSDDDNDSAKDTPANLKDTREITCDCGHQCSSIGQFCPSCGKSKQAMHAKNPRDIKCNGCGQYNEPYSKFCIKCGKASPNQATIMPCPQCRILLPKQQPFCGVCGFSNSKAQPTKKSFVYNEYTGNLVDLNAPMQGTSGAYPKEWCPRPALSHFKLPRDAPISDRCHLQVLQQLQGYLYQSAHEQTCMTIPIEEKATAWTELSPLQKALALVEGELHCLNKVHILHMDWKQAKRASGYTDEVYSLEETRSMTQQVFQEEKMAAKLAQVTKSKQGGGKKWEKRWEKEKLWQRGKDAYQNSKEHSSSKEDQSTMSPEALSALAKRTQQLEAALSNTRGGRENPKPPGKG